MLPHSEYTPGDKFARKPSQLLMYYIQNQHYRGEKFRIEENAISC